MTLDGSTAIVTGASRGFGRAIATALTDAGAKVVGLARHPADGVEAGDATDPDLAARLIRAHRPRILVLNAGAVPVNRPVQEQTWQTFSRHWEVDVRHVFEWTRAALLAPLPPGSRVVALSSGAAVHGSPASGGYAGAKATVRFLAAYGAVEAERAGLGIGFASLLPALTPAGAVGASGAAAYAEREGVDVEAFLAGRGPLLTAEQVGAAVLDLVTAEQTTGAWLLTPAGTTPA
ncbi:MAG TPA: SDR family oxidoreductase [Mycobacteriales bacterium]|jgi:NAD(P)-dependent dehydrogenase (short-subunit alcohol dehydrogenase family)|nr:SDR family oxidoreductase [Mycobacteriales bacterium]